MKLKILQGSEQIGGNIILIEGKNTRILLDFGIPLTDKNGNAAEYDMNKSDFTRLLPDIADLYKSDREKETVVFLSHAHPDHFGLLRFIDKTIPVYASKTTISLLLKSSNLLYENNYDKINFKILKDRFETKDFTVRCYELNHSVGGALGFKITDKTTGKTVTYTGDLRLHGRNQLETKRFIKECSKTDYLITEGTNLSRVAREYISETDVEDCLTKVFYEDKLAVVAFSPFNIDRLMSVYFACRRAGKTLVIDPYTAYILESFSKERCPLSYKSEGIKVYCVPHPFTTKIFMNKDYMTYGENKISIEEIVSNPHKYVVKDNSGIWKFLFDRISINDVNLVYSYWEGYLKQKKNKWSKFIKRLIQIHTSGHIFNNDLNNLIKKLNPRRIIPVHTTCEELFGKKYGDIYESSKDLII